MTKKKHLLPIIIILVAIIAVVGVTIFRSIATKPTTTEKQFDFSITYELDGEIKTISGSYLAYYVGHSGYAGSDSRDYNGLFDGQVYEEGMQLVVSENEMGSIAIETMLYADYLMGDSQYEYFANDEFAPKLWCYDADGVAYDDEETLAAHNVKLISWEYPQPIENSIEFSHIGALSGVVVIPSVLVCVVALVLILIFVKKDEGLATKPIDTLSITFNYIVGFGAIPFITLAEWLMDIGGVSEEFLYQAGYMVPALSVLCLAASVWFRRKGLSKSSLVIQLVGPAVFVILIVIVGVANI